MTEHSNTSVRTHSSRTKKWALGLSVCLLIVAGASAAILAHVLDNIGRTPRQWAPYIIHRAEKHGALVTGSAAIAASLLTAVDRTTGAGVGIPTGWIGASSNALPTTRLDPADSRQHLVGSIQSLNAAVGSAAPGDVIELLPGRYRIDGRGIAINRAGRQDAPITVRSARLGDVVIESTVTEAIKILAPDWHFENLVIRGACSPQDDSSCEHAFHVVGNAKRTVIHNNVLADFNAQIKINGEDGGFPDAGIIDHNTLIDTRARYTPNPVTPIDLDAASNWQIAGNLIADFVKLGGNGISYGAFAKAAGDNNVFERNAVLCEDRLQHQSGQRVGISLGGGGSNDAIRRDGGRSGLEHDHGRISDNLIAFCSDEGIYINRARNSQIDHNTLLDTSGIEVRFAQSSADIKNNIIDGIIEVRDDALVRSDANENSSLIGLFVGWHPQRNLFVDVGRLNLVWRSDPPRTSLPDLRPDLCGAARGSRPAIGAFEDFSKCLSRTVN